MILAGGHRQDVLAVDHHDKACFFAVEKLFDDDAVSGVAKGVTCQHVVNGGFRFFLRHGNNHTLASGQAVGLNDDRRAFLMQVRQSGLNFCKVLILRRRNFMTGEKIFSEGFGTFQLRCAFGWTEDFQPGGAERIYHANHQRRFRTNDGQVNLLVLGKAQQRRNIGDADSHVLQRRFQGGTGVTRGDKNGINQR